MTTVVDNYTHLKFKYANSLEDLHIGQMVQILESNNAPKYIWEYIEITPKIFKRLLWTPEQKLKFIRIPVN